MRRFGRTRMETGHINPWPSFVDTIFIFISILILFMLFFIFQLEQLWELKSRTIGDKTGRVLIDWVTLDERVGYKFGDTAPSDELKDFLRNAFASIDERIREIQADAPENYRVIIEVSGHTDNVFGYCPPGSVTAQQGNLSYSQERAREVINFLMNDILKPEYHSYLKTAGRSEWEPRKKNDTPENREQNRRVEIRIFAVPEIYKSSFDE